MLVKMMSHSLPSRLFFRPSVIVSDSCEVIPFLMRCLQMLDGEIELREKLFHTVNGLSLVFFQYILLDFFGLRQIENTYDSNRV